MALGLLLLAWLVWQAKPSSFLPSDETQLFGLLYPRRSPIPQRPPKVRKWRDRGLS